MSKDKIGWGSAAALVVANMIGTGVFTSLGFQIRSTPNTWSILVLWIIGGVIAIAGALCYAELGAYFKRSGGEYHYLTEIFHPVLGYLSGWVSLTVGFAAPVALAAMAMGAYIQNTTGLNPKITATIAVILITLIHSTNLKRSSYFQNITTGLKLVLISGFIILGLVFSSENNALDWSGQWKNEMLMPAFAISLVYVTFSYTGWNAAAYIVEEIKDIRKNLPKALLRGTFVVTVLYVFMQLVFLRHAEAEQLAGNVEVGQIVANNILGVKGGHIISLAIALFLISSISAMIWVGPRVSLVMAEDHRIWQFLNRKNDNGIPVRAIWFQSQLSLLMIWTGTFEQVLLYCGFILQIFSALSVAGTFVLRKQTTYLPYRNPTHPWLPLFFLLISIWVLLFLIYERPAESLLGLSNLALGLITYWISRRWMGK